MTEPWELSATDALALMRTRALSPLELLDSVIARAESVEPVVNAFAETRYDEARDAAKRAVHRYTTGERIRPLEGLPLALKEETAVKGWSWRLGSLATEGQVAPSTAPVAERIRRSGAIIHARTTTPEYSCTLYTHSKLWGITRNPWNPEYAVGGSSGGSGASLASGTSVLASGSDIGGSIRLPASANGVVGFKPPHGRVPVEAPYNLDRYCHDGPLARTVADCALFENILAGPHPADVTSLRPKIRIPGELGGIDGWRIALSVDLGGYSVDPEVETATRAVAEALRSAGAVVDEVAIPWALPELATTARRHFGAIFGAELAAAAETYGELLCDYTLVWSEEAASLHAEPSGFLRGLEAEQRIWEPIGMLFRRYRALVCPTWAVTGLPAGDPWLGATSLGGGPLDRQYESAMTVPFNILSACPVLAVPAGVASSGVPIGIQIVGRTYHDAAVFRIGSALERAAPWTGLAPPTGLTVQASPGAAT